MKKIFLSLTVIFLLLIGVDVYAAKYDSLPLDVRETFENFVRYFNDGDTEIYNIIDQENSEISINIKDYLGNTALNYEVIDVEIISEEHYRINTRISASGVDGFTNWQVSGYKAYFDVKFINDSYKVTDTDLFSKIGAENVGESIFKVFLIIGALFLGFWLIIGIIVICYFISKKKKKANNINSNNVNTNNMSNFSNSNPPSM